MKKIITPSSFKKETPVDDKKVVAPSQSTLHFLKAFARAYCAEENLPSHINGYCVN